MKFLVMFFLVISMLAPARADRLPPTDNTDAVPGFSAFKRQLLTAIQKRDAKFIDGILSPNIDFSYGGEGGLASFRKTFKFENPKAPFWTELEKVVKLGGSWNSKQKIVWYPYLFDRWPEKYDGLTYGVILGKAVPVLPQPGLTRSSIAVLNYDIVKIVDGTGKWVKIETPGKKIGYVRDTQIHSPGWRRVAFQQVNGKWMMTSFIAGD